MEEKDNLDRFFQTQLSSPDADASPNGWDVPSDRVWEGIEKSFKRQDRALLWWRTVVLILLALLTLLFAVLWFASQQQVKRLERTVAQLQLNIQDIISSNHQATSELKADTTTQYQPLQHVPTTVKEPSTTSSAPTALPHIANTRSDQPSLNISDKHMPMGDAPIRQNHDAHAATLATGSVEEDTLAASNNETTKPSPPVIAVQWPQLGRNTPTDLAVNVEGSLNKPEAPYDNRLLSLEFSFAPVLTDRKLSYKGKDIDTKFERSESSSFSWTAEVLSGIRLNSRMRLLSGLNYFSYAHQSSHQLAMRYTLQNATIDASGRRTNTYTTDVPTSFGDATVQVRVEDDGAANSPDLTEGRLFPMEFIAKTHIQHLGVPILMECQLSRGPVNFMARCGLIGSWVLDGNLNLEHVRVGHPHMLVRSYTLAGSKLSNRLNKFTLDLQIATGVQLNLSERLLLTLMPTLSTNLSPVFDSQKLNTNLYSWYLSSGVIVLL